MLYQFLLHTKVTPSYIYTQSCLSTLLIEWFPLVYRQDCLFDLLYHLNLLIPSSYFFMLVIDFFSCDGYFAIFSKFLLKFSVSSSFLLPRIVSILMIHIFLTLCLHCIMGFLWDIVFLYYLEHIPMSPHFAWVLFFVSMK